MKLVGVLLVINALAIAIWWTATNQSGRVAGVAICIVAALIGMAFVVHDRLTELTIKGVGTIKAASEQALADAQTVAALKQRVENQSATVDLVAKQAALAKGLAEEVQEQSNKAAAELQNLDKATTLARELLTETRALLDFTETVVAAQSDDRAAFDKLQKIAEDKSSRFVERAKQAWLAIFESHSGGMWATGFQVKWKEGIDPTKLSILELRNGYLLTPDPTVRLGLLEFIVNRQDISKAERLDFFLEILRTDPSLRAAEYAGRHFTGLAELKIKPLAVDFLTKWWSEHRQEFVQKERDGGAFAK